MDVLGWQPRLLAMPGQDRNQHWDQVWSETQMDVPWVGEGGIQLGQCRAKVTQVLFSYRASVSRGVLWA